MKHSSIQYCLAATQVAVLMGFPVLVERAEAWRGYSGDNVRGDGKVAEGPRGGVAVRAP